MTQRIIHAHLRETGRVFYKIADCARQGMGSIGGNGGSQARNECLQDKDPGKSKLAAPYAKALAEGIFRDAQYIEHEGKDFREEIFGWDIPSFHRLIKTLDGLLRVVPDIDKLCFITQNFKSCLRGASDKEAPGTQDADTKVMMGFTTTMAHALATIAENIGIQMPGYIASAAARYRNLSDCPVIPEMMQEELEYRLGLVTPDIKSVEDLSKLFRCGNGWAINVLEPIADAIPIADADGRMVLRVDRFSADALFIAVGQMHNPFHQEGEKEYRNGIEKALVSLGRISDPKQMETWGYKQWKFGNAWAGFYDSLDRQTWDIGLRLTSVIGNAVKRIAKALKMEQKVPGFIEDASGSDKTDPTHAG